jgi:2-polyprenyl-3-methyl-5-hydroxy-6-metoxy-1,4-benzoquinol methylase
MAIGPLIRGMFGPYEHRISEIYRSIFIDIDDLAKRLHHWSPTARQILEVGCGEGAVTERLRAAYPDAEITAIDITPRVGRLYRGSPEAVRFLQCPVQDVAAVEPGKYDLVVLSDVLHHVPETLRQGLFDAIRTTLAPNGVFVFKDWEPSFSPIHWLCYAGDRWLTGDRVRYMRRAEMRERLAKSFGQTALVGEARITPRWNNLAILVRP